MRNAKWLVAATSLALLASMVPAPNVLAAAPVSILLDGKPLHLSPAAFIQNGRTLVPVRGVVEAMGSEPIWNGAERTVVVERDEHYVKLKIDDRLACLDPTCTTTALMDVPATIVNDRTFIPVRFVATALGVSVDWDEANRRVLIDTAAGETPASPVTLKGVTAGQVITGPTTLQVSGIDGNQAFFYLVDPATRKGRLIAAGTDIDAAYTYTPDPTLAGPRQIIAAIRDASGVVHYSDPVNVTVQPNTRLRVTGITPGQTITDPITLGHEINFVATQVTYQLIASDGTAGLATLGPGESLTWYPQTWADGPRQIQVIAYDRDGNVYKSDPVPVTVSASRRTNFTSVEQGETVTGRARTLSVVTNYPYASMRFLLDGKVLATENDYWWKYGPEDNGPHTLTAEVTDWFGTVRTVGPINFTISTEPGLWLYGVGPGQVVTGELSLMAMPNVPADQIKFFVKEGGTARLVGEAKPGQYITWTPGHTGEMMIYADAFQNGRLVVSTAPLYFRAYMEPTYGPRPVVEKSQFKQFASAMAVNSYRETGMSAALQVAQAILETGWGQYVPVDKYTGQFSNNLFGIKGEGSAGSIVSTTWEVYNGQSYTVDANFRAYRDPQESWQDHKDLLLTRSWYAPFRAVMSDPVLGAWGLRKGGYATDPNYPVKLINIMKEQDLFKLDEIQF